ncbi:MAG TPA: cytochrome c oxidase subunit II [Verrucomicrobiae bacterium]|nr:cytochrome c oxidase subunit II [Verrucomicrobiae bacterium]
METGPFCFSHFSTGLLAVVDPVLSPASPQAEALSRLFVITLFICAVIFVIVAALVLICIVKFRARPNDAEPEQIAGNERLEVSWTIGSVLILVVLFALTVHAIHISDPVPHRKPDLTIIGHQWWWEARYPNGVVAANEIHIPIRSNLLVRVESADVIHDFWVPQLGRKMDMIPGHPNEVWIRADTAGEYLGTCAEYCGAEHAWMRIHVEAQTAPDYEKWLARQRQPAPAPTTGLERDGLRIFRDRTCVNCHTIKGVDPDTSVGPDLTHFAARTTIGTGVLENNPGSLRLWLANPQIVKPGCHMPDFHLTKDEVNALAAYLETTK